MPRVVAVTPVPITPAWTAAFRLRTRAFTFTDLPDVVVHAPAGFDATPPLHLVVLMHSMGSYAAQWVVAGDTEIRPGQRWIGWGLEARHDLAGTNTLLIVPQFDNRPGHGWSGRFAQPGFFRRFLAEVLEEAVAPRLGRHTLADVADLTLVGSSAGGSVITNLLAIHELDDRVGAIVLYDAFYSGEAHYLQTALDLLDHVAANSPTEAALITEIRRRYDVNGDAAVKGYARFLRSAGWVEPQGDRLVPTAGGHALRLSRDAAQAYRDLDGAYRGIRETLELVATGVADVEALRDGLNTRLGTQWTSTNQTVFRINWLRSLRLVARDPAGRFVPVQPAAADALAGTTVPHVAPRLTPVVVAPVPDLAGLITRLQTAAVAGGTGADFEAVVAAAFARLGFEVTPIGGSGDTDLVARGRRGRTPVVLVVDAKSRGGGVVGDGDIHWLALADHRAKNGATAAVVVGPRFAEGSVRAHARQAGVRLLAVDDLAHLLREHDATPLGVDALTASVFTGTGCLDETEGAALLAHVAERAEIAAAVARVFEAIWSHQTHPAPVDRHGLYFILRGEVDLDRITEVVAFLQSPVVAAVDDGGHGLRTRCSPAVLATRLERLAGMLRRTPGG